MDTAFLGFKDLSELAALATIQHVDCVTMLGQPQLERGLRFDGGKRSSEDAIFVAFLGRGKLGTAAKNLPLEAFMAALALLIVGVAGPIIVIGFLDLAEVIGV